MSERAQQFEAFREYATARESEALDALIAHGNDADAAEAIGSTLKNFRVLLHKLKKRAAKKGWAPAHDMTKVAPPGFHIRGVTQQYDDGVLRREWVRKWEDKDDRLAVLLEELPALLDPIRAQSDVVEPPETVEADWLTVYPMGDPHIGMFAWGEEAGVDFDLQIAERNLFRAVDKLVTLARPSETALIVNLGDFFHADNSSNRTARSGHSLDVDTRYSKVVRVGVRLMRRIIDRALEKHAQVRVINEIGNHDDHSAVLLGIALEQFYENNPRVSIDTNPGAFHYFRFGQVLIGTNHGDQCKRDQLPMVMANDRREDWGLTRYHYFYTGHVHHEARKEYPGCVCESLRTLAPRDAYHARAGYRSDRSMCAIGHHKDFGERYRVQVTAEEIEAEFEVAA